MAADLKLVGAVAIKVRPDARGFKGDLQRQISKDLRDLDTKATVDVDGDTSELLTDVDKATKAIQKKSMTLKVGLDYDSVRKAQLQLDSAMKGLSDQIIKVKLDEEGIKDAQNKVDGLMADAQIEMQFIPDEKGYQAVLDKIAAIRREKLADPIPLTFGWSEAELREKEQEMKDALAANATMEISYLPERGSIEKMIAKVKAAQDEVRLIEFESHLDPESLVTTREILENALSRTPVELKVDYSDQASLKALRDRLKGMLSDIRSEPVEVMFDEAAIKSKLEAINMMITDELKDGSQTTIRVSYNNNRASLERAIAQIKTEQDKIKAIEFDVTLDKPSLKTARQILEAALAREPVQLRVNYDDQDSLKATRDRLKEMLNESMAKNLDVQFNPEAIRAELAKINKMIKEEIPAEKKVDIPVHTTRLELVARQLQFASRARRVPFHVVIDQKSMAIAEGVLRSLAGVNTLQSFGRGIENMITKFDTFILKGTAWATALGGVVNTLTYMSSAIFTVAGGMVQVIGLAALAPAAFGALASTLIIGQSVFKDFGAAVHGIDAALKRLPPSGQKAAVMVRGVFKDMRENISERFWGSAADSMLKFVETSLPKFTKGLVRTSGELGRVFAGILDSFTNLSLAGGLDTMFNNLVLMFSNAAGGATALWDALNILGLRGSEFLPKFGTWLTDISVRFRNWIDISSKNGNITAWIENGITALKDMYFATGALIDQAKGLTRAFGLIGDNGLDDFRRNMEHIAKIMNAEPFQSRMASVFFGAKEGAHELNRGIMDLAGSLGDAAHWTGNLLQLLGKIGGDALSGLSKTISNANFQDGITSSLRGISDMLRTMEPAFDRFGSLIGNIGTIAAEVFRGLGPVFNTVLSILDDTVQQLVVNLAKIAPDLLRLTNSLLTAARAPLQLVVNALDGLLTVLNLLPSPLRNAVVAFGVFLLLRNQFGAFAESLSKMWTSMTSSTVAKGAEIVSSAAGNFVKMADGSQVQMIRMADGTDRQMNRFGTAVSNGATRARASLESFRPDVIPTRLGSIVAPVVSIVGRINSALALIGGIPGLVMGALGAAISYLGGQAADAAANIDTLKSSLDRSTGAATPETYAAISASITDINDAGDAWANFWRGVIERSKAGNETLDKLGINVGYVSKTITGSQAVYDGFVGRLKALGNLGNLQQAAELLTTGGIKDVSKTSAFYDNIVKQSEILKNSKLNPNMFTGENGLKPEDVKHLVSGIEEQRKAWIFAQAAQSIYAQTLGVTTERSREVAAITQTLGDKSMDASGKIDAIRRSLDLLNNRAGDRDQKFAKADGLAIAVENAQALAVSIKAAGATLIGSDGLLSEASVAARGLYKVLAEASDNVLIAAQRAYDTALKQGDTAVVAASKARDVVHAGQADLEAIAKAAGVSVETIQAEWDGFFGEDWTLTATFVGRPDLFLAAAQAAQEAGVAFDKKEFTAWLLANGDPATVTTDEVKEYINSFATAEYRARLEASSAAALYDIAVAVGAADAYKRGDYAAILRALNQAGPGVQQAINDISRVADKTFAAVLYATLNGGSLSWVNAQLDFLARPRLIDFKVNTNDLQRDAAMALRGVGKADGGILNSWGREMFRGFARPVKHFAGGGIENHVAQIQRAGGPVRIWAEPETKAEAYIPYAQAKRPRSVAILTQVAKDFGFQLTKATSQFASGGINGSGVGPTSHTSADVHIGSIHTVDMNEAVAKLRQSQRDALAVAGISSIGV